MLDIDCFGVCRSLDCSTTAKRDIDHIKYCEYNMINYSVIAGYFVFIFIFSLLVVKDSPCSAGAIVTSVCSAGHKITGQAAPKIIPTIYIVNHRMFLYYGTAILVLV